MSTPPPSYDPQNDPQRPGYAPPPASSAPQYPAAPAPAPAPGYAPPAPTAERKAKGPATLGIIAFVVAIAGAVIGSLLAFFGGVQLGGLAQYADISGGSAQLDANDVPAEGQSAAALGSVLVVAGFAAWGILALWGFIQGIIAAVRNRGRGWGIAAIVLAVLGVGAVLTLLTIGTITGAAPYVTTS